MSDRRSTARLLRTAKKRALAAVLALLLIAAVLPGCPGGEREGEKPAARSEASAPDLEQGGPGAGTETSPEGAGAPSPEVPAGGPALRTIVLVIDGLVPDDVRPGLTPQLCRVAHCPGTTAPDPESHATTYAQARTVMLAQTNANHVAMMTGEYAARSGVIANAFYNRRTEREQRMDEPALIGVPTIFDLFAAAGAEPRGQSPPEGGQSPPALTAGVFGKEKLRRLFDCTRRGEECGPSNANPENEFVTHAAPDILTGSAQAPAPGSDDCPAEPAESYGVAEDACIMDRVIEILDADDPAFVFVNLGRVDFEEHAHGPGSPEAGRAVQEADRQVGRLVAHLKDRGEWARTVLIVLADHSFSAQSSEPPYVIDLRALFEADRKKNPRAWGTEGGLEEPYAVITAGGAASVVLTDLRSDARRLGPAQSAALKRMREVARFEAPGRPRPGVSEALYRLENERDAGHTLGEVHPAWGLETARLGELLVTALSSAWEPKGEKRGIVPLSGAAVKRGTVPTAKTGTVPRRAGGASYEVEKGPGYVFAEHGSFAAKAPGNHGQPGTRHIPFIVVSGGDFVIDQIVEASNPAAVNVGDDTAALPEQAEVVDVAPTVLWLEGLLPADAVDARALLPLAEGRVLREAFKEGWAPAAE